MQQLSDEWIHHLQLTLTATPLLPPLLGKPDLVNDPGLLRSWARIGNERQEHSDLTPTSPSPPSTKLSSMHPFLENLGPGFTST